MGKCEEQNMTWSLDYEINRLQNCVVFSMRTGLKLEEFYHVPRKMNEEQRA